MPKIVLGKAFRFSINKSTIKLHVKIGTWIHLYSILALHPVVRTMGVMSRIKDDPFRRHCLFLDYDDAMYDDVVLPDIEFIQREYGAGTAIVLQSSISDSNDQGKEYANYHVIFPQKFSFAEVSEIIRQTHTDYNFREVPAKFNFRSYVLRIYPKYSEHGKVIKDRPWFKQIVHARTSRETNLAMYDFLKKWYLMPKWRYIPDLDSLSQLNLIHYTTTGGWKMSFQEKIKRIESRIKMQVGGILNGQGSDSRKGL